MALRLTQKRIVIPTAGTSVQFFTESLKTSSAIIIADPANAGTVWIGDSDVDASSKLGTPLIVNETLELTGSKYDGTTELVDLSQHYVDVESDGDAIIISYYERTEGEIFTPFQNLKSLDFDGVNEAVNMGNNYDPDDPSDPFTWSFWVKFDDFATQRHIMSKMGGGAVYGVGIYITTAGKILVQHRAPSQLRSHTFAPVLTAGIWYNLTFTYSGNNNMNGWRMHTNGVIEANTPSSGALTNSSSNTGDLLLGRRGSSFYYKGKMQNVSRWDKSLSEAEVSEIYNSGTPLNLGDHSAVANLTSWWKLNDESNFPTEEDAIGSVDGTLENMATTNYESDVPA